MLKLKKNIIAAREKECVFCDGVVYKIKTRIGIIYQYSKCGSLYK